MWLKDEDSLTLADDLVNGLEGMGERGKGPEQPGAPAPGGSAPGASPLPSLFVHNVIGHDEKQAALSAKWKAERRSKTTDGKRTFDVPFVARDRKTAESLFLNASALLGRGVERCAFVTITTQQNLSYWTPEGWEAARTRFRSFVGNKGGLAFVFGDCDWCRVIEPQRRGAIHWHLLIDVGRDIRSGVDFEAFGRKDYRSAGPELRGMWSRMRESAKRYNLGRVEIMPIKSEKWEAAARYVGKYISKGIKREVWEYLCDEKERPSHSRRVGYSTGGWRRANSNFMWLESGSEWRKAVQYFALSNGLETYSSLSEVFGKKWAFFNRKTIQEGYGEMTAISKKYDENSVPF